MDKEQHDILITKLIVRSWQDAEFKARLLEDPTSAMEEIGIPPSKSKITPVFVENTEDKKYFILPEKPRNKSLEKIDILAFMEEQQLVLPVCERF